MTIEVTAKKVDEAIKNGLEQLGASLDEVQVEVIESGGLFRKAKVRLTLERETAETAVEAPVSPEPKKEEKPVKPEPKKAVAATESPVQKAPDSSKSEAKAHDKKSEKPGAKKAEKSKNDKSAGRPAHEPAEKTETAKSEPSVKKDEQAQKSAETTKSAKKSAKKEPQPKDRKQDDRETGEPSVKRTREDQLAARKAAATFVKDIVEKMGFDATVELDEENGECINITAAAGDDSLLIGRHGETLTALSYIAETAARAEKNRVDITVDCNGYRERRAASLSAMARRRANECANKHRRVKLEPMERIDRRTIHNALTGDDRVTTASEGKEPYRYVVILPAGSHKRRDQKPHYDEKPVEPSGENDQEQE